MYYVTFGFSDVLVLVMGQQMIEELMEGLVESHQIHNCMLPSRQHTVLEFDAARLVV